MKPRNDVLMLSGIILLGFLFRFLDWRMESTISRDGIFYIRMATMWHDSGYQVMLESLPGADRIPFLFLWIMKCLMAFGISAEAAGVGVNLVLGSLLPLLAYGIATIVCGKREIALGAALLAALHPALIELSIEVQRDTPYLFFAGLTVWSSLAAIRRGNWYWWGLGGIAGALAVMNRYEAFELPLLVFGYLAVAPWLKWETWRRAYGLYLPCFAVLFVLTVFSVYRLADVSLGRHAEQYYSQLNRYAAGSKWNVFSHD